MTTPILPRLLKGGTSLFALCLAAQPLFAEDSAEQITVLDAIVITGEKLARSLQNTAASVAAFGEGEIEERKGAATVSDLVRTLPNVIYTDTTGAPIIRGQDSQGPNFGSTAFFGGTLPRATINLDGHYLSYNELVYGGTSVWDVERVEVFRGPQTSSQGANSIAGAIIIDTKDPTFEREGALRVEGGSRGMRRGSLMVSGPLSDSVAARFTLDSYGRDTFITYTNPSFAQGGTDQDISYGVARLKLLWVPSDLTGFEAKLTLSHTETDGPTWETASTPYEDLNNATTSMPSWSQNVNTAVADISYDFGNGLRLTNQLQYSNLSVVRLTEPVTSGTATIDRDTISNETRLNFGDTAGPVDGVAGLYYSDTDTHDVLYLRGTSEYEGTTRSLGLFTEMNWRLAERWTLTGGLRYQRDEIERYGSSTAYAVGVTLDYDETFDAVLPKLALAYEITPDLTVGGLINRGYNPGGVNLSFASGDYITFEEETAWNYELFTRAALMDGRLNVTGNIFYTDYRDSQRLLPDYLGGIQYGSVVVNAERAEAYGLELGVDFEASAQLHLRLGLGLMHSEIGEFTAVGGTVYEGNEFAKTPGHMISLGADWNIRPDLRLSGDLRYTDGYYSSDENDPNYAVEGYTIANARLTWNPRDNLELYGFVNNIFDERTPTYFYDDRAVGGIVANMTSPREIGVGLMMRF